MFVSLAPQKPFQLTLEKFLESHLTPVFWPHWAIFEVRIKPSCDYTFTAGPDLTCPSFRGLNSDNFPFFWILYCSPRTRVTVVWRSVNIYSHTGWVWLPAPVWQKFQQMLTKLQNAVTRVIDEQNLRLSVLYATVYSVPYVAFIFRS